MRQSLKLSATFAILLSLLPAVSFGMAFVRDESIVKGSVATAAQLKPIYYAVEDAITPRGILYRGSKIPKYDEINALLEASNLPKIDATSDQLEVIISNLNGFAGETPIGFNIVDGKHQFCLPCQVGHNDFVFGILPLEKK